MHLGHLSGPKQRGARIGINAHLLSGEAGYRRAGIHRYIAQILHHLPREESGPKYVVYTNQRKELAGRADVTAVSTWLPTQRRLARILWEQIIWPWQAHRHRLDLLHSMAFVTPLFSPIPAVVTVFDLSFMHKPESFPSVQRNYLATQTRRSCRRARRVITISQSARDDVHRFFDVPLSRIDVIYPGVDEQYRPATAAQIDAFRRRKGLPSRYILHVGTLQPRKNLPRLVEAFSRLADTAVHLVFVGGKGWLYEEIFQRVAALNLTDRVHFAGYAPDEELPLWYAAADLFVFPSVYEGFGMPVVEAMACGAPVLAANAASIPEAVGSAGQLFDPHDVDDLARRMANVLNNDALSATMRQRGFQQAQQFSWQRAGLETAVVYQKALSGT